MNGNDEVQYSVMGPGKNGCLNLVGERGKKGVHRHSQAVFDHKTLIFEFFFCLTIVKQDLDFV